MGSVNPVFVLPGALAERAGSGRLVNGEMTNASC
jgi:hypothetical protein